MFELIYKDWSKLRGLHGVYNLIEVISSWSEHKLRWILKCISWNLLWICWTQLFCQEFLQSVNGIEQLYMVASNASLASWSTTVFPWIPITKRTTPFNSNLTIKCILFLHSIQKHSFFLSLQFPMMGTAEEFKRHIHLLWKSCLLSRCM